MHIHLFSMAAPAIPPLPCLCSSLRRTARSLTQLYEQELRPLGLRSTQFTILQVLDRTGELTQGRLGEILAMDSTSLTRTLAIMLREGWLAKRRGRSPAHDARERLISFTPAGKRLLDEALPAWESLQSRLRRKLGAPAWNSLMQLNQQLTQLATQEGDSQ